MDKFYCDICILEIPETEVERGFYASLYAAHQDLVRYLQIEGYEHCHWECLNELIKDIREPIPQLVEKIKLEKGKAA